MTPRSPLWTLLGFAALLLFAQANQPASLDVDSLNFAASAKQMARTGEWLRWVSPIHGWHFADHPPGCVWVMALCFKLFGISIFTAKFFSLLCGLGIVALTYWFGKKLEDPWAGFFAGLTILATNHFLKVAHQARFDVPMMLFMMLALRSFLLATERSRWHFLAFGLWTSLAIMAKGAPALATLGIALGALALAGPRKLLVHPLLWLGVALAFSLPAAWAYAEWRQYGTFTWQAYWNQQLAFSLAGGRGGAASPWYHYLELIVTKQWYLLPWYLGGLWVVWKKSAWHFFLRGRPRKKVPGTFLTVLLTLWPLCFLTPLSFGHFKLHHYLLPIYPALAVMAGLALNRLLAIQWKHGLAWLLLRLTVVGFVASACLPIRVHKVRFGVEAELAPLIDRLAEAHRIDTLVVFHQDASSLAFYTNAFAQIREVRERTRLEEFLSGEAPVLCFLGRADWEGLSTATRSRSAILINLPERLLIANR